MKFKFFAAGHKHSINPRQASQINQKGMEKRDNLIGLNFAQTMKRKFLFRI